MRAVMLGAGALAACIVLVAGCGGSDEGGDATTEWAGSLCSSLTAWTESLGSAAESIRDAGLSRDGVASAVDEVREATETLVDDLEGLGAPDVEGGDEARDTLATLAGDLRRDVDAIEAAVDGISGVASIPGALKAITSTFATMGTQVQSAFSQLGELDARGELEDAFRQADECDSLVGGS